MRVFVDHLSEAQATAIAAFQEVRGHLLTHGHLLRAGSECSFRMFVPLGSETPGYLEIFEYFVVLQ